jgi:predicted transcriptional regulator
MQRSTGNRKTTVRIKELNVATGVCIKTSRIDCDKLQGQVADVLGWSLDVISDIEKGRRTVTVSEIIVLAEAMGESPEVLFRKILGWKAR